MPHKIREQWILLDRDGVINEDSDHYIKTAEEWQPIPGSIEAIARLSSAGYAIAVITNQSGLARGLFQQYDLDAMHTKMHNLVSQAGGVISALYYCPHLPEDLCSCRKPKPGMLEQLARDHNVQLKDALFVGDSLKDLQAATAVNTQPILVKTGKGQKTLKQLASGKYTLSPLIFDNLAQCADELLKTP